MDFKVKYFNHLKEEPEKVPQISSILTNFITQFKVQDIASSTRARSISFSSSLHVVLKKLENTLEGNGTHASKVSTENGYITHRHVTDAQVLVADVNQQTTASILQVKGFTIESMIIYAQDSELDTFERLLDYLKTNEPKLSPNGNLYYLIENEGVLRLTKTPFSMVEMQYQQAISALADI